MIEWFEDPAFWEETYPYMFPQGRMDAAPDEVDQILALAEPAGAAVLDLCCGPGRHSVELARRDYRVTGVDRTPFLLDKARAQGEQQGVQVEWVQEDMRRFVRPDSFDLVINMFTAFGYFRDKDEDLQVLRNIRTSLRSGGILVLDVIGKERLARIFTPTSSELHDDGTLLVQRREVVDDWSRMSNEWILIRDGRTRSLKFSHTIYSAQELRDRIEQAGFGEVRIYGGLDGAEYGVDCKRLVAVARRE